MTHTVKAYALTGESNYPGPVRKIRMPANAQLLGLGTANGAPVTFALVQEVEPPVVRMLQIKRRGEPLDEMRGFKFVGMTLYEHDYIFVFDMGEQQ